MPKKELTKPPNNASRLDARWLKNGAAILARRLIPPGGLRAANRSLRAAVAAVAVSLVCSVAAQARGDAAAQQQQFQAGRNAFEAQNYAAALEAFEAAAAAGLSGPAVHFNIGVAAFRLGRYSRAQTAFKEVARTPEMAALAHYNLGLVALRRGASDEAIRWFSRAEQEAGDERLRNLASSRLAELLPQPSDRDWVGYAAFGAGYDDNVALISDSDVLGVSGTEDGFAELQFALSAPLARPWRLDAGLTLVDYQDLDNFDQLGMHGGGRYRLALGDWMNEVGLQLAYTLLDGQGFENKRTLALQTSTVLRPDWQLRGRYSFSDIDGLNDFSGLSGRRHEAGARIGWRGAPWDLGIEYQLDVSDYDDEAMSATRHQMSMDLQRSLRAGWAVLLEVTRQHSRYDVQSNGIENRTEVALALTRALGTRWRLIVRYAYADNDADLAEFNYQRSRLSAGVEAVM